MGRGLAAPIGLGPAPPNVRLTLPFRIVHLLRASGRSYTRAADQVAYGEERVADAGRDSPVPQPPDYGMGGQAEK